MKMCGMYLILAVLLIIYGEGINGMSEKQLAAAVKLVKNVCQPKTKATAEDIDKMHQGDWNIDRTAMCYMHCALASYKLIDEDNKFNYESAMSQLKQLPEVYKEPTRRCSEQCKESAVTLDDQCIAAYEISKCIYFCTPEYYFLP